MHTLIQELENASVRSDVPSFRPGDTLEVHVRVVEGNRSRIQVFKGFVLRRQGGGSRDHMGTIRPPTMSLSSRAIAAAICSTQSVAGLTSS